MGLRRKSREIALQFLFGHDFQERDYDRQTLSDELVEFSANFDTGKKSLPYARQLINGICERILEIDQLLAVHSHHWRLERMSLVDRNILRIAAFEMRYSEDVPDRVAMNEALEVAKHYSKAESVPFINGILNAMQDAG